MLYDSFGRPVIAVTGEIVSTNVQFINSFYVRIKNGQLQLRNLTDNKWYYLYLENDPTSNLPVLSPSDTGEDL